MDEIIVSRKPFIIVISGPSGTGKSTIADSVMAAGENLYRSVSFSTRPPRGEERNGREYRFLPREEFIRRRDAGELLEWAEVYGNLYGTPADSVDEKLEGGINVLLEIDVQGGMSVKEKRPDTVLIFLLPPSIEELERRLRERGTDEDGVIRRRLENARRELSFYDRYDYLVVNDEVEACADAVLSVIRSESLRRERADTGVGGAQDTS